MADSFDKRITAARADLAAAHLKGKVDAKRFVEGEKVSIRLGRMSLYDKPTYPNEQVSELLYGEIFTIYERGEGWAWGQADTDGYVGYIVGGITPSALAAPAGENLRVKALMAPVYVTPAIKGLVHPCESLPLNAVLHADEQEGDFIRLHSDYYVHKNHVGPVADLEVDFVAVAERFVGAPYVWGGKTAAGLDCSGLIQTALQAIGKAAPRDTDMMEKALGEAVNWTDLRRGDLIFWKGHMGVMLDAENFLHANAFHMQVAIESLSEAMTRIERIAGPVTAIKRL